MGLISELFIASPSDITDSLLTDGPRADMGALSSPSIDTVKLSTLHALLAGESVDDFELLNSRGCEDVGQGGDEGPWVARLYPEFVQLLASGTTESQHRVIKAWTATEEF